MFPGPTYQGEGRSYSEFTSQIFLVKVHYLDKGVAICLAQHDFYICKN